MKPGWPSKAWPGNDRSDAWLPAADDLRWRCLSRTSYRLLRGQCTILPAEVIINGVGATPIVQFYRRLDHFGRGFDVMTLGQRNDVGLVPSTIKR